MSVGPRGRRAQLAGLALAAALAAGCATGGAMNAEPAEPAELVAQPNLMLRGWIGTDRARLGAALSTAAAPTVAPPGEGPYRLRGFADDGSVLFDVRFDESGLATLPGGTDRHFSLVVGAGPDAGLVLARIELDHEAKALAQRSARLAGPALAGMLASGEGLELERAAEYVVLRWDPGLYSLVQLRDLVTGQVMAFGRDGEIRSLSAATRFEVTVSDGVRSAAVLMSPR